MDAVDALIFALLVVANLAVMVFLHQRRSRRQRMERMMRSLRTAVRVEIGVATMPMRPRFWQLRRAS